MNKIFLFFYKLRKIRPVVGSSSIRFIRSNELIISYFRSLCFGVRGVLMLHERSPIPLIGRTSRDIFERGARIEVAFGSKEVELIGLEQHYFFPKVSLGLNLPAPFLNPPTGRKSRFRLLKNAVVRIRGYLHVGQGFYISVKDGGVLELGDKLYIGKNFYCSISDGLHIGERCLVGDNCTILDYDGHPIGSTQEEIEQANLAGKNAPIRIEDDVWIGWNVMITKGVVVGQGSVVAANSFVTRSVPPRSLVMGNPARVVKEGIVWKR